MPNESELTDFIRDALRDLVTLLQFKNTNGGVLLFVKLQTLLKVALLHGRFSRFLNCTNDTKSREASHMIEILVLNRFKETKSKN